MAYDSDLVPEERERRTPSRFPSRNYAPAEGEVLPRTDAPPAEPPAPSASTQQAQQAETLPSVGQPQGQLPSDTLKQRITQLRTELGMGAKQERTPLQKFGHTLNVIGQGAAYAVEPELMTHFPGTIANKHAELATLQGELGPQLEREARGEREKELTGIEQERNRIEIAKLGGPGKVLTGPYTVRRGLGGTGPIERAYESPSGVAFHPDLGETMPTVQTPSAAPAPAGAPADEGYVYGAPKELTAEQKLQQDFLAAAALPEARRTDDQKKLFNENVARFGKDVAATPEIIAEGTKRMDAAYAQAQKTLGANAPPPPKILPSDSIEKADEKQHRYETDIYNKEEARRKDLENLPAKEAALELQHMRIEEKQRNEQIEAQVSYGNLYAQENYRNNVLRWQKSPSYVKDVGLVNSVVNEARSGGLAGPGMGTSVGALLGGAIGGPGGAVVGAAAGTASNILQSAISGPVNGYLEALKKNGISNEGYQAMQAYFNALPGRMAYELTTQGLKASTMRSSQLLQKVMQTIPSPDTPADAFPKAFDMYYKPMKTLTDRKYLGRAGFAPPPITDFYPEETGAAGGAGVGAGALPPGARIRKVNPDGTVAP